jgi:hypothetical protein
MNDDKKPRQHAERLAELEQMITEVYGEELWTAIKTGIAVIASLSFKNIPNPITLLYEGGAGRGKSTIINILNPDRESTRKLVYRLDNFTPKSFVSHAANVPQGKIEKIDLLPQLTDKTLLVKELAPLFKGRDDELRANFAVLTAVLDGKGYVSASGVHGTRGYEGKYVFNWLGATTPVPPKTDAIMAQLGNRILRYEIVGRKQSEQELVEFAQNFDPDTTEASCRDAVNYFLEMHFAHYPTRIVSPGSIEISDEVAVELVRLAELIADGRIEVTRTPPGPNGGEEEFLTGISEGPHRIIVYLRTIALGLALISGRTYIGSEDLDIIRLIAFSTINFVRRGVLREVLVAGGTLTSTELESKQSISRPTARARMRELAATGIVSWKKGVGNVADSISLAEEWKWLLPQDAPEPEVLEQDGLELGHHGPESKVPLWVQVYPFNLSQT